MYKLLIVDDEYEIRNGLCNYFPWDQIGFEIAGCIDNGQKALDFMHKNTIDVLLCDVKMPVSTGIDVAKQLYSEGSKIKIVFLSGYRDFEYARKAMTYGVKTYILKPTKYNELFEVFTNIKIELDRENIAQHDKNTGGSDNADSMEFNFTMKIVDTIKRYIEVNYKNVNLENAAEQVHMNPFYLSRFFKQKTGQNFSDFVISIKMIKALEFLKDTRYKTYEVSEMIGYSNAKNFTRTFKRYYGKSPKDYRHTESRG